MLGLNVDLAVDRICDHVRARYEVTLEKVERGTSELKGTSCDRLSGALFVTSKKRLPKVNTKQIFTILRQQSATKIPS